MLTTLNMLPSQPFSCSTAGQQMAASQEAHPLDFTMPHILQAFPGDWRCAVGGSNNILDNARNLVTVG